MASFDNHHWMRRAIALAEQAERSGEVPVGAVLLDQAGQVMAEAFNQPIGLNDPTAHAEIQVLRQAGARLQNYRLINTTLYVTLEPCPMCVGALIHARVKHLIFGTPDPRTGAAGTVFNLTNSPNLNHHLTVTPNILALECQSQLQQFFRARR